MIAMKRTALLLSFLVCAALAVHAQDTPKQAPDSVSLKGHCLLDMEEAEWAALDLTAAQIEEVRGIQTQCKTDCTVRNAEGGLTTQLSAELLRKHQERLAQVLTPEQFMKWVSYCQTREAEGRQPQPMGHDGPVPL